jgi:hypothetical protein
VCTLLTFPDHILPRKWTFNEKTQIPEISKQKQKIKYLIAVVADKKVPLRRREERATVKSIPVVDLGHNLFTTRHFFLFSVIVKVLRKKISVREVHIFIGNHKSFWSFLSWWVRNPA